MNNLKKILIAFVVFCSVISFRVFAQSADQATPDFDYGSSWYIGPTVNVMHLDPEFNINKDGQGVGLRVGKSVSESWDIQLETSYAHVRENNANYQQNLLGVEALYMLSRDAVRPFLLIGTGALSERLSSSAGAAAGSTPYLTLQRNVGLGFQVALNDQWSMQADYRHVFGYLRDTNSSENNSDNNNYLTIGINYAFDKPPVRPAIFTPELAQEPTPTPTPMPEVAAVTLPALVPMPKSRSDAIVLHSTQIFSFNTAVLKMPVPKLDEVVNILNENTQITDVVISGYTDRLGSDKYNQNLSEQRANAVKNYLVSKGVDANRLNAIGKGKADPVVVCSQTKQSALIACLEPNRRVEIVAGKPLN